MCGPHSIPINIGTSGLEAHGVGPLLFKPEYLPNSGALKGRLCNLSPKEYIQGSMVLCRACFWLSALE